VASAAACASGATNPRPGTTPVRVTATATDLAPDLATVPVVAPARITPAAPGTLISAAPVVMPAGTYAWRITYHTRDQSGADVAATGVVLAPSRGDVPAGGRPVVAFGHGTTGIADACAPSRSAPFLSSLGATFDEVKAGYVVAAADYIGLGGPGEHAIYVARPEGQAMLDIARAARQVTAAHAGGRVVLWGYSQGGQAALAAGALAASYAPDLDVRGVVATAPLADLPRSLGSLEQTQGGVAYLLLAAYGVSVSLPGAPPLANDLTARGKALLATAERGCALDLLAAAANLRAWDVFVRDPLSLEPYASTFAEQFDAVIARMPPVMLLQGDADDVIRQPITDGVVRDLCAVRTIVEYHRYPTADHATIFATSEKDMNAWIADRFASAPPPVHDVCLPV
jgi:pimeloyl-ACP methyl ester carboxylesterase